MLPPRSSWKNMAPSPREPFYYLKLFVMIITFCESFPRLSLKLQILYKGESGGNEVRTGCSRFMIWFLVRHPPVQRNSAKQESSRQWNQKKNILGMMLPLTTSLNLNALHQFSSCCHNQPLPQSQWNAGANCRNKILFSFTYFLHSSSSEQIRDI